MPVVDARILILCKTYPSPSGKYAETTCVAGMDENGMIHCHFLNCCSSAIRRNGAAPGDAVRA
ncbi:hypothetical protein [Rhizobium sp. CF142]|uniref:hypothetical protein n=1 Tax=Rhizobium sp. CF142 TaxID=1144314 RepID=UPI00026EEF67|nr:hypothetical protein [Rhizobium sp. CF142]EJJ27751.1 hypothetical protein PMI11_03934 [Rhizobium sp. CF142]